jgi:hypothetical protein
MQANIEIVKIADLYEITVITIVTWIKLVLKQNTFNKLIH